MGKKGRKKQKINSLERKNINNTIDRKAGEKQGKQRVPGQYKESSGPLSTNWKNHAQANKLIVCTNNPKPSINERRR